MEDFCEESSNNSFSLNGSFNKFRDIFTPEEKSTAIKTENSSGNKFNEQFLNGFSNNFKNSNNENDDNGDDNENLFINKKTKRDEEIKHEKKISDKEINFNIIKSKKKLNKKEEFNNVKNIKLNNNLNSKEKKTKQGRKNKESVEERKHDKNDKDNIMYKLKSNIFSGYIRDITNENSLNKDIVLKKLRTKEFTHDLSKQNNERLFNMKIKDILSEQPISTKYSTFNSFENKLIIDKIYKENKEIKVIKILELAFEELLIIYRRTLKDPEDMEKLEKIKTKIEGLDLLEKNNKSKGFQNLIEDLRNKYHDEEYIEKVKNICLGYKNWFNDKKERKLN